jgi:hypothetical protein
MKFVKFLSGKAWSARLTYSGEYSILDSQISFKNIIISECNNI